MHPNFTYLWFIMNLSIEYGRMKTLKSCRLQIWESFLITLEEICQILKQIFFTDRLLSSVLPARNIFWMNTFQIEMNSWLRFWTIRHLFTKLPNFKTNLTSIKTWNATLFKSLQTTMREYWKSNDLLSYFCLLTIFSFLKSLEDKMKKTVTFNIHDNSNKIILRFS